jgi:hypothetical protein
MQIFFAFAAWIILSLQGLWSTSICRKWLTYIYRALSASFCRKWLTSIYRKWPGTRGIDQIAVLKFMLPEFQEAQCCFMLATQIAVLVSFRSQATFYKPKDIAQLDMDNYLGQIIGTGGLLPVSLVLFTLNNVGKMHWDIIILSGITLAVSTATVITSFDNSDISFENSNASLSLASFYDTASIDGCGGNPPPIVFCDGVWYEAFNSLESAYNQAFVQTALGWIYFVPIMVFLVVLFQKLLSSDSKEKISRQFSRIKRMAPQLSRLEGPKLVTYLNGFWIVAISILYLVATYVYLTNLYYLKTFGAIDTSNWTLGQIVAVTIWAPVMLKYIQSAFRKFIPSAVFNTPLLYATKSPACIYISHQLHNESLI